MSNSSIPVDQSDTGGYQGNDNIRATAFQKQGEDFSTLKSCLCDCSNCINTRKLRQGRLEDSSTLQPPDIVLPVALEAVDRIEQQPNITPVKPFLIRPWIRFRRPSDEAIDISAIFSSN